VTQSPPWMLDARCAREGVDTKPFFEPYDDDLPPEITYKAEWARRVREAVKVCCRCLVRTECLAYALDNGEPFGVWGGLTQRARNEVERSQLRIGA